MFQHQPLRLGKVAHDAELDDLHRWMQRTAVIEHRLELREVGLRKRHGRAIREAVAQCDDSERSRRLGESVFGVAKTKAVVGVVEIEFVRR